MATTAKKTPASSNGNGAGRTIDLNKARAARAEVQKDPVHIDIGDQSFELPAELSASFALLIDEGRNRAAVSELFGEDADRFWDTKPSMDDLRELLEQVATVYGLEMGE